MTWFAIALCAACASTGAFAAPASAQAEFSGTLSKSSRSPAPKAVASEVRAGVVMLDGEREPRALAERGGRAAKAGVVDGERGLAERGGPGALRSALGCATAA